MNNFHKLLAGLLFFYVTTNTLHGQVQPATNYGDNKEAGKYKKINNINLYYEIYGTGRPLIFLHGNGGSIKVPEEKLSILKNILQLLPLTAEHMENQLIQQHRN